MNRNSSGEMARFEDHEVVRDNVVRFFRTIHFPQFALPLVEARRRSHNLHQPDLDRIW